MGQPHFDEEELASGVVSRPAMLPPSQAAHPAFSSVRATVARIARYSTPILIVAPQGCGAERVAREAHEASPRCSAPLITMPSGGAPPEERDVTLERCIADAARGTLFIDEVAALPPHAQLRLRSALDGGLVRVIAATQHDLKALVESGRFDHDLFYRLDVIHLELAPLRDRRGEIGAIAAYALGEIARRIGARDVAGLSGDALEAMRAYEWPGNLRELESVLERAVVLATGTLITRSDLPERVRGGTSVATGKLPQGGIDLRKAVEDYENALILEALARTGGNKHQASRLLGINRTTLVEMLKRKKLV